MNLGAVPGKCRRFCFSGAWAAARRAVASPITPTHALICEMPVLCCCCRVLTQEPWFRQGDRLPTVPARLRGAEGVSPAGPLAS